MANNPPRPNGAAASSPAPAEPRPATQQRAPEVIWQERTDPKKVEWTPGLVIEGVLLSITKQQIRDQRAATQGREVLKETLRYTVLENESGETIFFTGTHVLNQRFRQSDVGHFIYARYEGDDANAGRQGQAMMLFKTRVSQHTAPGFSNDGSTIGDDDIPF